MIWWWQTAKRMGVGYWALAVGALVAGAAINYAMALAGAPQQHWLVCEVMGGRPRRRFYKRTKAGAEALRRAIAALT